MTTQRGLESVPIGRVVRPHGVRGELVVESYSELLGSLAAGSSVEISGAGPTVRSARRHKDRSLIGLVGVDDRDAAEALRGLELAVVVDLSEPLPEGTYYRWQIIGLTVVTDDGKELGTITDILETGANDVYEVTAPGAKPGAELLLPAIAEVILQVDLEAGRMTVKLPDGLRVSD